MVEQLANENGFFSKKKRAGNLNDESFHTEIKMPDLKKTGKLIDTHSRVEYIAYAKLRPSKIGQHNRIFYEYI